MRNTEIKRRDRTEFMRIYVEESDAKVSRLLIKIQDDASSVLHLGIITVLPLFAIKVIEAAVYS